MQRRRIIKSAIRAAATGAAALHQAYGADAPSAHADLVTLFEEWREFERPPLANGAPDYTQETFANRQETFNSLRKRLVAMDTTHWPVSAQVDHAIVRAEMNGYAFNEKVLKPWTRDPAFYAQVWTEQSDTPAHEGPTNHALIELWTYDFPLSEQDSAKLTGELASVPAFLAQARMNLTGDARDLWVSGVQTMKEQSAALNALGSRIDPAQEKLLAGVNAAIAATDSFVSWAEAQAPGKTGPSGIGKENYTWMLRHVHLIPMTWEDEAMLLERELNRALAALKLEESRNRELPELSAIGSPEEYERRGLAAVRQLVSFLDERDLFPMKDYMIPALDERIGSYAPPEARNFFAQASHREPMTLYTHFYHWWDLKMMALEPHPSPVRQSPLLYNIWDSRAEGMATAMEEMMLHAGLYDDNPRAREIVWVMLAQRAARGLASLYAQANEFTMQDASDFHVEWTPRGWMSRDSLLGFEQQLYLRQPGYGTSYVTGKHLIEGILADRSKQAAEDDVEFGMKDFFRELNSSGLIPASLIRWELTGDAMEVPPLLDD
ncbi:MAG: DUF885 family protein [Alphaproteobacteria bacterium]|nr:DUF885 family protein [Alphaproteobacteria bacterium]